MLHVTCDVIGIAQYHFLKSKMVTMYFALYQNFKLFLLENVRNRTKTVLVTLIALNTRNLSERVFL